MAQYNLISATFLTSLPSSLHPVKLTLTLSDILASAVKETRHSGHFALAVHSLHRNPQTFPKFLQPGF